MASSINPNNIDTTYPIAGQDNDSQGFRDNFTNIKTNFEFAESEIDDLQSKVLLKSALTGTSLDNDLNGALMKNAKIQGYRGTLVDQSATSGSITLDYSTGHYHTITTGGNITIAFSNLPATGNSAWLTLRLTVANTGHTMTLPSAVGNGASAKSVSGIQGFSSNIITFSEIGTYEFVFHTQDGGTTIYLNELTRPRNRFVNPLYLASSEDLANGAAASLSTTASYFSTSTNETATLGAGVDGQIKTFMMTASAGSMVITVTNAGWKTTGSGTGVVTIANRGQGCTLQYIDDKWYCIGNNGATFSDA